MCAIASPVVADYAAQHFLKWLAANPKDDDARKLATAAWIDTSQFDKALDYWEGLLKAKPNDPEIMGTLAGINLKADDWRKSIEWYIQGRRASRPTPSNKVASLQFIGNVAWSKLNSKTLTQLEAIELADRGIGALQKAAALQPKNPKPIRAPGLDFQLPRPRQGASLGRRDRSCKCARSAAHYRAYLNRTGEEAAGA